MNIDVYLICKLALFASICFAAAAAAAAAASAVAAAAISKSYHYSEIDQKQCFCCISLIKYDLIITMKETLFYHSSIVAAASTVAATVAASKIFIKRFLLFHMNLYVDLLNTVKLCSIEFHGTHCILPI